jgi:2-iminobutanoate/2-iminopropanoate deaminase
MKNSLIVSSFLLIASLTACNAPQQAVNGKKRIITLENTPSKRPYSPAVEVNNMLFVSGQVATDISTGKLIEGGIEEQARKALSNLRNVIEKSGYTMQDVVRCTVLLSDISFYGTMNQIYMEYFQADPPARMAFAVKDLPLGSLIEIDAIAVK